VQSYCQIFSMVGHSVYLLVSELNNAKITARIFFFNNSFEWLSLAWQLAALRSWA